MNEKEKLLTSQWNDVPLWRRARHDGGVICSAEVYELYSHRGVLLGSGVLK